jgi:nicotinamidase-related amidase
MIAVLVIDMQNAYFEDTALQSQRRDVTAGCNRLIAAAQESGAKVLLVKTEHEKDKSTWSLNMLDDDQGFIFRGTTQADFVSGLATEGLPQLVKTRDSAFLGTDLIWRLRTWDVDTVVLAGISTHNCIAQTGADAFGHNYRVIYADGATASENAEATTAVLQILRSEYRQQVLEIAKIEDLLGARLASRL